MTLHYHGTPITPRTELLRLAGRHFCVSFANPRDAFVCHQIGQSVMLDNGAFTRWRQGLPEYGRICPSASNTRATLVDEGYNLYVAWALQWCEHPTTWCVIPDSITGDAELNQRLEDEWPRNEFRPGQSAPVWHLHEPIDRLWCMIEIGKWQRICIGSSGDYATPGTDKWHRRMDVVFNRITSSYGRVPVWFHMLRGMALARSYYPFASLDSTDVAQNHKTTGDIVAHADRWDGAQCKPIWQGKMEQMTLEAVK